MRRDAANFWVTLLLRRLPISDRQCPRGRPRVVNHHELDTLAAIRARGASVGIQRAHDSSLVLPCKPDWAPCPAELIRCSPI